MPLIVENGTGLPDADSYCSLADALAYLTSMGESSWAAVTVTDEQREAALRRGTQYIDTHYRFLGEPLTDTQALAWPRDYAVWPVRQVIYATCELALRALSSPLTTDVDPNAVTSEKVGSIAVTYAEAQRNGGQNRYPVADRLLATLTGGGRNSIRVDRA